MENLYSVRKIAIKLSMSEKGVYSWILSEGLKPIIKKNGVGCYRIESFPEPKISFSEDGQFLIIASKLNNN